VRRLLAGCLLVACASACAGHPAATARTPSAAPQASSPAVSPSPQRVAEWPQYMHDARRSGLGPIAPTASNVQPAWTAALDGVMYASSVVAGGVVVAATENDSVYAFELSSGKALWQRHLGSPVPRSALPCGDVDPTGITGTPVIDLAAGSVYVSGFLNGSPPAHHLFALALADGGVRWDRVVDPPGLSPLVEQQRGALALGPGFVYVPFGGLYGDCGAYKGAVVGVPVSGSGDEISYVVPVRREGGIWATPGPVSGDDGTLWVATGNAGAAPFDHGDSVEHLRGDLSEADFWAPADWSRLSAEDADIGSTGPVLLDGGLVFQAGKTGTGYLLRGDHLGGIGGEAFSARACPAGVYGGVAYATPMLYVPCIGGGVAALRLDGSAPSFSVAWTATAGGETPIVAYGRVWSVSRGSSRLVALDPATGAGAGAWPIGSVTAHFTTPAAASGRILVSGSTTLYCFTVA
jgi:outer membrane protein assembly factor BamB